MASSSKNYAVKKVDDIMPRSGACQALAPMNDHDKHIVEVATDRFELRLAEENGKLRVEMANGLGELREQMATGFGTLRAEMIAGNGALRAEMIDQSYKLLKWTLLFWATHLAAIAALLALFR